MYRFATRAFLIILTVTISFQILNGNNGISLLVKPGITVFAQEGNNKTLELTHGIASGDVTNDSAVVWARSNREAQMHVEYDTYSNFSQSNSLNSYITGQSNNRLYSARKARGLKP